MYCTNCGAANPDSGTFCNQCGQKLPLPGTIPPMPRQAGQSAQTVSARPADAPTDGKAVASLILGILSLTFFWVLAGIPAIILGHMSRGAISRSMGRLKGEGMALAGLIMGYLSVAALPFVLIIAAIAIPNLLRARMAANEASAVGSLRTVNSAVVAYADSDKNEGFPANLRDLERADLIDGILASGQKSGYRFTYRAEDSDGDGRRDKYFINAEPVNRGSSGKRSFCSDESGVIRVEVINAECTAESNPIT